MTTAKNTIKAPQKSLMSSWKSEPFSRSKAPLDMVKRSLGNKPQSLVYHRGGVIKASCALHSNEY